MNKENLSEKDKYVALAKSMVDAGDSVMQRIYSHVKADGGRIDEQIDKNSGVQKSAKGLTWSYANILHAIHTRKSVGQLLGRVTQQAIYV